MTSEIDAAGAFLEANLVAGEIEARRGHAQAGPHAALHAEPCRNCGAALQGSFCSVCGQSAHLHSSLLHLIEELLHGLFHFDAKGWRTLPLLVARPGQLTRRYIDGQRVRFVSPLALFLFMMFLMFLVASLTNTIGQGRAGSAEDIAKARLELDAEVAKDQAELDRAQARLARATAGRGDLEDAREAVADARDELSGARIAAEAVRASASAASVASAASSGASAPATAEPEGQRVPGWARALRRKPPHTGHPFIDAALTRAAANPELTVYQLKSTASKYTFMLVPISLPFLWLMFFWRRGVTMYDHAIFALYSLSFMSLLLVVLMLLGAAGLHAPLPWLACVVPPVHMAVQLRATYRLGLWSTLWRTALLLIVAAIVLGLYLLLILVLTMG